MLNFKRKSGLSPIFCSKTCFQRTLSLLMIYGRVFMIKNKFSWKHFVWKIGNFFLFRNKIGLFSNFLEFRHVQKMNVFSHQKCSHGVMTFASFQYPREANSRSRIFLFSLVYFCFYLFMCGTPPVQNEKRYRSEIWYTLP